MWVWHPEMLTSPPEVLENGVPLMVQSPHLQQLLCIFTTSKNMEISVPISIRTAVCTLFDILSPSSSGSEAASGVTWEEWWLPNAQFIDTQSDDSEEYFSYIISPDCSSCELTQNTEDNYLSSWNTDDYGNRTAYHMTGTIFGCLSTLKANKDCMWDTDTYECPVCTRLASDEGLCSRAVSIKLLVFPLLTHCLTVSMSL